MAQRHRFDSAALAPVPSDLKALDQWVTFCLRTRPGQAKATKVPYSAVTGGLASTTAPATWSTFDQACRYAVRHSCSGVGFVFCALDDFFGIDLDKCRDPLTGAIESWAMEIVRAMDTYCEITPSETGLHIIGKGALPPGQRRTGQIETYDKERYFTVTGDHLRGSPLSIEARQTELDAFHAKTFGARPAGVPVPTPGTAASGETTDLRDRAARGRIRLGTLALLDSTGAAGYPSASEADGAVAAGLARAGLTADEVYTVLRESVRGRAAMERKGSDRHGDYYLRRTADHAAAFVTPVTIRALPPVVRPSGVALPPLVRPQGVPLQLAGAGGRP